MKYHMKEEHVVSLLEHMLNIEDLLLAHGGQRDVLTQGLRFRKGYLLLINKLRIAILIGQIRQDCPHFRIKGYVEEIFFPKADDIQHTEFNTIICVKHLDL